MSTRFRGTRRDGVGVTGVTSDEDLATWVQARFVAGWRALVATRNGEEVARIGVMDGRRNWWAEK